MSPTAARPYNGAMQSPARHTGALVPWACATIVFLVSLGVVAGSPGDGVWTVDCGSKELQARRLVDTGYRAFDLGYTARALDPSGRWFPVPSPYALRRGDRYFAQYPVAYAAVAAPFFAVFGPVGLRVPAALGLAACAALIAAWVAPALGRRWSLAAGLGVPLATPLVFYGVTIWEHSLTVALALGAQLLAARAGRGRLAAAGFLIGCATWFREELFLMGLALAAALLATRRRPAELLWLALGALPAALGLLAFNALVLGHPLGSHILGNVGAVHSPSFGEALRDVGAIIAGYGTVPAEGAVFVLVVVVCLVAGWQTGRSGRALGSVVAGIAAVSLLAWLLATVRLANASHPVLELARTNGFALRMPVVALAGAGAARVFARSELSPLRFGMAVGLFFLAFGLPFRVLWTDFLAG
ncbi:MAG: hypothetical protein ACE5FL_06495, partial [Myxococcota bacterium]